MKRAPRAFLAVLAVAAFALAFRLGERSFRNPDEGRYAEIAREMAESGDWVEPRLYGVDYLSKPPLFYWLVAGSFKAFGFSEAAARAVPSAFAWLGVAAAIAFAARFFGGRSAWFAGLALATNLWYLEVGRYLLIDAVFSCLVAAALMAYYAGLRGRNGLWFLAGHALTALSFVAKGFAGPVLVAGTLAAYFAAGGRAAAGLRPGRLRLVEGALFGGAIVLPWFVAVSLRQPDFMVRFFVHEHLQRFVSKQFEHQAPWYFYLAVMPAVLLPWTLFPGRLAAASPWAADDERRDARLFALAAALVPVAFYSLSRTKLATYIVPSLPFCALLVGEAWSEGKAQSKGWRFFSVAALSALALACAAFAVAAPEVLPRFAKRVPEGLVPSLRALVGVGGAAFAGAAFLEARRRTAALFAWLVASLVATSMAVAFVMESLNVDHTTRPFAAALKREIRASDDVYLYDQPGAFMDFRFYLGHPVKLAGLEGELKRAQGDPDAAKVSVPIEAFQRMLEGRERLYCLMRKSDFEAIAPAVRSGLRVVREDARKVLFASGGSAP